MSDNLSKAYKTRDEAAMGGFERMKANNDPIDTDEFAFYIIRIVQKGQIAYHYTPPVKIGANGGEASWHLAPKQSVQAYCHTHPKRVQTEEFSSDDFKEYKEKALIHPYMVWYLLTPQTRQIRLAEKETDFPRGKPIKQIPVTP